MKELTALAITLFATTANANPTTQACLGDFDTFLTCPAGSQRSGHECRAKEPQRGQGTGEHWSGSRRQGPSLFLRDSKTVSFAANYKNHKKTGRVFRFDDQGRLEGWTDVANDEYHGLSVTCLPDGRVYYMAYYKDGRAAGISRAWRSKDGSFSYAFDHDDQGRSKKIQNPTAQLMQRPDQLCQPQRCDVNTAPDLSGLPKP